MWDYIVNNLIFFIIIILCLAAIISILVILSVTAKKARAEQQTENTDVADGEDEISVAQTEEAETEAEAVTEEKIEESPEVMTETKTETKAETGRENKPKSPAKSKTANKGKAKTAKSAAKPKAETAAKAKKEPKAEEKTEEKAEPAEEKQVKKTYSGKWVVTRVDIVTESEIKESAFFFRLLASNGGALLSGEDYTSLRGAIAGIDTFKGNIAAGNFKISATEKGKYIVKLLTSQGNLLAQGEKYNNLAAAKNAVASIKRFAATAVRSEVVQNISYPYQEPVAVDSEDKEYDYSKKGKWVIHALKDQETGTVSYYFDLKASNGKVLLTSEDYATLNGLKNGIGTHKTNIAGGNVRACLTRSGDYIMKIFTADNRLLALGGHYAQKQLCLNAIESVKRFAATAEIDESELKE